MKCKYLFYVGLLMLSMVSCQEEDNTVEEYPNWRNTNEAAFLSLYSQAKTAIESGSTDWLLLRSIMKPDSLATETSPEDYVVVRVIEKGYGIDSPYQTDSVSVHYQGRLLPSVHYPSGKVFDQSFYDVYQEGISIPFVAVVGGLTEGFATALQHMHQGDYWEITVPYQLGYGATVKETIPAYSTLIFTLRLEDFWSEEEGDRY